jgi:hypothetical protein
MNKAVIVLVLTTAAASFACMHLVSELRDERARTDTLQTRITELERAVAQREQIASVTPTRESPFSPFSSSVVTEHEPPRRPAAEAPSPTERPSARAQPDMSEQMKEHFERQRELMQDPKYREAIRKQQRAHMDSTYPGLEEALGLSAEEKSRFLDLLSRQQTDEMAKSQEMMAWNSRDPAAIEKAQNAITQRQQRNQEELDAQFGPSVRQKWTEYQESLGARHRVAAMQSQLALAGAPLNADQSKAVLNALVEEQRRQTQEHFNGSAPRARLGFSSSGPAPDATDWTLSSTDWTQDQERSHERMLSTLQSSLTSQQIEHIEGIFSREREAQRASMELMRAQGVSGGNAVFATGGFFAPAVGAVSVMSSGPIETEKLEDATEQ